MVVVNSDVNLVSGEKDCGRILIVDDETNVRKLLNEALSSEGYDCHEATSESEAMRILGQYPFDLAIIDINMPGRSGIELLTEAVQLYPRMAVIMATARNDADTATECFKNGAHDYITKPFQAMEDVTQRIGRALEEKRHESENEDYLNRLQGTLYAHEQKVLDAFTDSISSLVLALEAKDHYTCGHSRGVAWLSAALAREISLSEDEIMDIKLAGLLHDIGKIGIDEKILNKPSRLTEEEIVIVRRHPVIGERILSPIRQTGNILKLVRGHHERYGGKGYPDGLSGEDIPIGARILAIVDSFDAMIADRPYRPALDRETALRELCKGRATYFDPHLVDVFTSLLADRSFLNDLGALRDASGKAAYLKSGTDADSIRNELRELLIRNT